MADEGFISIQEGAMAALIAASATFQSVTGAANAAAALAFVHRNTTDETSGTYSRPRALVFDGATGTHRKTTTTTWERTGMMFVDFEFPIQSAYKDSANNLIRASHQAALADFKNNIGKIIDEMKALAGQGTYLCVVEIEEGARGLEEATGDVRDYWLAQFAMTVFGL